MIPSRERRSAVFLGGSFPVTTAARCLAAYGTPVCVFGSATSVSRFSRSVTHFVTWPRGMRDDQLVDYLVKEAGDPRTGGGVLFPCSDEHMRIVAQNHELLGQHFFLTTPSWKTVRVLYDKRLTYALAEKAGVVIPRTQVPGSVDRVTEATLDFPVVLRPAISSLFTRTTHRKLYRADNPEELKASCEKMSRVIDPSQIMVQELLPGPSRNLVSYAGYFKHGEPLAGLSVRRPRQLPADFGRTSSLVEAVEIPELRVLATQLLRALHYTGLAEVEFMWDARRARYVLLEVNARLWAWHSLAMAGGLNLPYLAFQDAIGEEVPSGAMRYGLKWVRFVTDIRAATQGILTGRLGAGQYLASLRGQKTFSVFSKSDPLPFLIEPFLLAFGRLGRMFQSDDDSVNRDR